jgi:putative component of toxin-antitoxin plasmid stabilization module
MALAIASVYFIKRADLYVVLLAGGEKSSQAGDITKALALAREL